MKTSAILSISLLFIIIISSLGCILEDESFIPPEVTIHLVKDNYQLGENITFTISVSNKNPKNMKQNLSISVLGLYAGLEQIPIYTETKTITVNPNSFFNSTIILNKSIYKNNGEFHISASCENITNAASFTIVSGLKLTLEIPETVKLNEDFNITLIVENIYGEQLNNITINALFNSQINLTNGTKNTLISKISTKENKTISWIFNIIEGEFQTISFIARSERGDYKKITKSIDIN